MTNAGLSEKGGWFQTEAACPTRHYFNKDNLSLCHRWLSSDIHRLRDQTEHTNPANCPLCQSQFTLLVAKVLPSQQPKDGVVL